MYACICGQLLDLCASEDLEVQGNSLSALVRIMFNKLFALDMICRNYTMQSNLD